MSLKKPADLATIMKLLKYNDYEIRVIDGVTQNKIIEEYQSADIFISTSYPKGFSLLPLDAMACGFVGVGFTGGAGSEFMIHDETALVAEDGDCQTLADMVLALNADPEKKETIRLQSLAKANEYGLENTKIELNKFYQKLLIHLKIIRQIENGSFY